MYKIKFELKLLKSWTVSFFFSVFLSFSEAICWVSLYYNPRFEVDGARLNGKMTWFYDEEILAEGKISCLPFKAWVVFSLVYGVWKLRGLWCSLSLRKVVIFLPLIWFNDPWLLLTFIFTGDLNERSEIADDNFLFLFIKF